MRLISIFSILLACCSALGFSSGEWVERLSKLDLNDKEVSRVLSELRRKAESTKDKDLLHDIDIAIADAEVGAVPNLGRIVNRLRLRSSLEGQAPTGANSAITRILSNPVYRDVDDPAQANWIGRALERLAQLLNFSPSRVPSAAARQPATLNLGGLFTVLLAVLAGALAVALFFALRHTRFRRAKRVRKGLLDEDEPFRRFDEWLEMADRLQSEGKYREAVRCLYLAILTRLDKARIIRFERTETNWEHLHRIESSSAPRGVDYKGATTKFDYIWYGERPATLADCEQIRSQYVLLTESLKEVAA